MSEVQDGVQANRKNGSLNEPCMQSKKQGRREMSTMLARLQGQS